MFGDNANQTSVSTHSIPQKSAFSQALENHKKDYISMVSNNMAHIPVHAGETRSDVGYEYQNSMD